MPDPDSPDPWAGIQLQQIEELRAAVARSVVKVLPSQEVLAEISSAALRIQEQLAPAIRQAAEAARAVTLNPGLTEGIEQVRQIYATYIPHNWRGQELEISELLDVSLDMGLCIVWVPNAEILKKIVTAEPEQRWDTLAATAERVLDDLDAVLDRAKGADVRGHPDACAFAQEAIAAARDGHWHAAQALAASGLGHVLQNMYGFERLGAAHKRFKQRDIEEAGIRTLKTAQLEIVTARALTDTRRRFVAVQSSRAPPWTSSLLFKASRRFWFAAARRLDPRVHLALGDTPGVAGRLRPSPRTPAGLADSEARLAVRWWPSYLCKRPRCSLGRANSAKTELGER